MSGKRQYKQPTRAQLAQVQTQVFNSLDSQLSLKIEEKKRIQQQAQAPTQTGGGMAGVQNVVTQLYVMVFERESKQLLRAVTPQEFNVFVKGLDMKPSELDKHFFVLPMPLMDGVKDHLEEWMREGKSGKQEKIEVVPEPEEEESVPMSPGVSVSVSELSESE
jgi:hypothetical protein